MGQDPVAVSVVIPVYNGAETIEPLLRRLDPVLRQVASRHEVILVNDGSRDESWQRIVALTATYADVTGIDLMRNYGQHNALLCGIRRARHDVIVTMDDDLQHPPEAMPALLAKVGDGFDVVYGTPITQQHGLWRDMASQITKLVLQGSMGAETARSISAFRAFRTPLREAFAGYRSPFVSIDVLLTWGTIRFAAVPVRHDPRHAGTSNYTVRKLMTHALSLVTGFSTLPLQFASMLGFAFTLFGIAILVYVLGRFLLQGGSVAGFPFLASIIAIFSGVQMFALGVIGEYLARMHFQSMERPSYAVRRQIMGDDG
ncbi:MAG: glycosyltransferase family 2 protein [Thermomicrobiales bacterium]